METVKSSAEISTIFARGTRLNGSLVTLLVHPTLSVHDPGGRVAFIAGKKLGGAVWRNRAKRRLRSLAREMGGPWQGLDVIFIATRATTEQMYSKVLQQAQSNFSRYLNERNI